MRSTSSSGALLFAAAQTLLFAAGCSDEALVSFTIHSEPGRLEPGMVTIRFTDEGRTRSVSGEDFALDGERSSTPVYATRTRGSLEIDVEVESGADVVSSGTLAFPLRSDWRWNVEFFLADRNPHDACIGCFGYRAYPVAEPFRTSPAESLWTIWGGNSISNPVVY